MKERLVGAAVLIAIAVWLIPWVLDGPDEPLPTSGNSLQLPAAEEPMPMRTETLRLGEPPQPSTETPSARPPTAQTAAAPVAEPEPAGDADESAQTEAPQVAAARATPEATRPAPAAAAPPKPAPSAAGGDWAVQLGSFGEEANAERVAQRAGVFGYKADVSSFRSGGRTLYRVRVGPQRTRAEADATASALRAHGIRDASVVAAR